jgi:hypothetical protein
MWLCVCVCVCVHAESPSIDVRQLSNRVMFYGHANGPCRVQHRPPVLHQQQHATASSPRRWRVVAGDGVRWCRSSSERANAIALDPCGSTQISSGLCDEPHDPGVMAPPLPGQPSRGRVVTWTGPASCPSQTRTELEQAVRKGGRPLR